MLGFILRKLKFLKELINQSTSEKKGDEPGLLKLTTDLEANLYEISNRLGNSPDIIIRRFTIQSCGSKRAALIFIDGLADKKTIENFLLRPLMVAKDEQIKKFDNILDFIAESSIPVGEVQSIDSISKLLELILAGNIGLLVDRTSLALVISSPGWPQRAISEPDTEVVVNGPREGFTETLRTNTTLLRRRIGHPDLRFETIVIGKKSRTDVCIAYIKGVVNEKLVAEVRRRLQRIDTDAILAAGFVVEYIEDAPFSPFPTVNYTERPDVCAAQILEGRIAIIIDGTPVVNTVPMFFVETIQSPDDYNFRSFFGSMSRWFRSLAFMITILLPAFYVALSSYHQELVPTPLMITMAAAHEGTPFPSVYEVIGMGLIFEILREAGIRIPRPIGQTVSIVGALVIGDATVSAGLVGAPVIIVVALTAITSFVNPKLSDVGAILRVTLTILAGVLGAYGILIGITFIYIHLSALRSFGLPYLTPVSPLIPQDLKDVAVRVPIWAMITRPKLLGGNDPVRQEFRLRLGEPDEDEVET